MIVMKNVRQPFGPSYQGMVVKRPFGGVVIKRPFQGYGVMVDQPKRLPWRGYNDVDWTQMINTGIGQTGNILTGATGLINTITGANKTGTVTVPGTTQSIQQTTGYGPSAYNSGSMFSSVPSYVWIAGGVLVLGGVALMMMK